MDNKETKKRKKRSCEDNLLWVRNDNRRIAERRESAREAMLKRLAERDAEYERQFPEQAKRKKLTGRIMSRDDYQDHMRRFY